MGGTVSVFRPILIKIKAILLFIGIDPYKILSLRYSLRYLNDYRSFRRQGGDADLIQLIRFDYVDDQGNLHQNHDLFESIPFLTYGCGIYTFQKKLDGV